MSGKKKAKNKITIPFANLESYFKHEQVATEKAPPLDSQCCINVHSKRYRLADSDGISAKACIDGLVLSGILTDDSPQFVKEVSYSQEKIKKDKEEETIITIEVVDNV